MKLESLLDFYLVAQGVESLKESVYPCVCSHEQRPGLEKVGRLTFGNARDIQAAADKNWSEPAQTVIDAKSGPANAIRE